MKLSKQERIAVLIIVVVLILGLGAWLFVKPQIETMSATAAALGSKQAEYDGDKEKCERKEPLKDEILKAYEDGEHMADMFFAEMTAYEADKAFRAFLEQCTAKVVVESLSVSRPTTVSLGTHFYVDPEVEYDLKTYATQGADPAPDYSAMIARQAALGGALGDAQTIGASTVEFTVSAIDQEELIKFADEVNNYKMMENGSETRKAVGINGLVIEYPLITAKYEKLVEELNEKAEEEGRKAMTANTGLPTESKNDNNAAGTTNPDGTPANGAAGNNNNEEEELATVTDYLFSYSDTFTFYCIERMQDPTPQLDAQDGVSA